MNAAAIIVAGGTGKRMNAGMPKQLIELSGKPIIEWTLEPFFDCPDIAEVIVVSEPGIVPRLQAITAHMQTAGKPVTIVTGGTERQDSVRNGLAAVGEDCDSIAIHDAVRPFVRPEEISACLRAAVTVGAATLMISARDTVKTVKDGRVEMTLDRTAVWLTQTPQAFRRSIIEKAHAQAALDGFSGSDDCVLVERLGLPVQVVEGSDFNIKITTPADLAVAGVLLDLFRKGARHAGHRPRV